MIRDSFLVVNKDVSKGFVVHILSRFNAAVTAPVTPLRSLGFLFVVGLNIYERCVERFNVCYSSGEKD